MCVMELLLYVRFNRGENSSADRCRKGMSVEDMLERKRNRGKRKS